MKKLTALLLALSLLLGAGAALAEIDLTYVLNESNIFTVDESGDVTYITDTLDAETLHFEHAHESEYRWSFVYFELAVIGKEMPLYPLLRVVYNADDPLNLTAISFDVSGKRYTFDLEDTHSAESDEQGTTERAYIFFSTENLAFLAALSDITNECDTADEMRQVRIQAVLHGDEDLTVTLSEEFLIDYWLVIEDAFVELGGLDAFEDVDITTEMTVTDAPAPAETPVEGGTDEVTVDDLTDKLLELFNK